MEDGHNLLNFDYCNILTLSSTVFVCHFYDLFAQHLARI